MARIIITLSTPLIFFFILSLLSHQTVSQPEHMVTFCNPSDNFTQTSSYQANRDLLLSSLRDSSSLGTYSNATVGRSPNKVHGMFLCRGDTTAASCSDCVQTATSAWFDTLMFPSSLFLRSDQASFFTLFALRQTRIRSMKH
uniref:Gnk2-homologous domain-containing protein n=1 Tax=Brassica campestris TaxID=3711 RepID=A0A3P5XWR7_BRACM|nr:unnamed protein product [Brassica rapa]